MAKVRKAKKLFVFGIALVDWMIGFAFPLLVYANGRGAWASEAELRDLLDIIFTVPWRSLTSSKCIKLPRSLGLRYA